MKISKKPNLVIPVLRDTGTIYVHSMPLSRDVFEQYFVVISKAFASIYNEGLAIVAGPRVAALTLKMVCLQMGITQEEFDNGVMGEIRRLTNVLALGPTGWETIMFSDPAITDIFDEDEISEIEGAIVFFILCSAMHKKETRVQTVDKMAELWKAQVTSSSLMDYRNSLATSIAEETSEPKVTLSSIPL